MPQELPAERGAHPVACRLGALDASARARQRELLTTIRSRILELVERPDGFVLRLPAGRTGFSDAAEWIGLERLCCPFAGFAIEWRSDDAVWVTISGPEGAKDVLAAEMGLGSSTHG